MAYIYYNWINRIKPEVADMRSKEELENAPKITLKEVFDQMTDEQKEALTWVMDWRE